LKWLLNSNIIKEFDKTHSNGQRSFLHLAAKHGENEILKLLCTEYYKRQLSIDIKDAAGNTAAHLAAKYNHLDCLQVIIEILRLFSHYFFFIKK
jgi:ankyrin repeat protein